MKLIFGTYVFNSRTTWSVTWLPNISGRAHERSQKMWDSYKSGSKFLIYTRKLVFLRNYNRNKLPDELSTKIIFLLTMTREEQPLPPAVMAKKKLAMSETSM